MPVYGVDEKKWKDVVTHVYEETKERMGKIADVTIGEKTVGRLLAEEFGEYDPYWDRAEEETETETILERGRQEIIANFLNIYGYKDVNRWLLRNDRIR